MHGQSRVKKIKLKNNDIKKTYPRGVYQGLMHIHQWW
jgi:hypothetical protein